MEKLFGSHRGEKPIRNLQGAVSIHALLLYNLLPKISSWRSLEQVAAVLNLFLHFFARLSEYLWKEEGAASSGVGKRAEAEETSASEPPRRESGVGKF
jgi:hypothetical protein